MRFSRRSKMSILFSLFATAAVIAGLIATGALGDLTSPAQAAKATTTGTQHVTFGCDEDHSPLDCTEIGDYHWGFNYYVGHDEPSTLFYSNVPGSGNQMQYELTLPKDPPGTQPALGRSWNFQLHPAFWFGMAMCDTQSYPEQVSKCAPDTDKNIVDPALSPKHPGAAFMEMQFYPPGWVAWPNGNSCDPTKWCAALNIDSLSQNPVTGQSLNNTCQGMIVGGVEYINFAFITKSGTPQPNSPPNPLHATLDTFTPNPSADLFMNSGDDVIVKMHDTAHGLEIDLNDQTTGHSGSMTASAANGFGQITFAPNGNSCTETNYDFHPMYSTSSEKTRVPWTAHSYNIAFSDEIGHFDYCNGPNAITPGGSCPTGNNEGIKNDQEPADADDNGCFPASSSTLVQVSGCLGTNSGFDGVSYQHLWPDGNTKLRPTPIRFTSPLTGADYNVNYSRTAFEADLPRVEDPSVCDRFTGQGCTLIPTTDDLGPDGLPEPAAFYPFYSIANFKGDCVWQEGNHIPGSKNDFGQNQEYGTLLNLTYTGLGGAPTTRYNDFRQIFSKNPCPSNN